MKSLARTRSQYFVSSPRRVGSPFGSKSGAVRQHAKKRQKLADTAGGLKGAGVGRSGLGQTEIRITDDEYTAEGERDGTETDGTATSAVLGSQESTSSRCSDGVPLDSRAGAQRVNRGASGKVGGRAKPAVVTALQNDVFTEEGSVSPRKRKRGSAMATPPPTSSAHQQDEDGSDASGSWADDTEDFDGDVMPMDDLHYLKKASAHELDRLRKRQLIRLCEVAALPWRDLTQEEQNDALLHAANDERLLQDENPAGSYNKEELRNIIVNARFIEPGVPLSTRRISALPSPRPSPRRDGALGSPPRITRLRSASSLANRSASASSSNLASPAVDMDVTPKALGRPRPAARFEGVSNGTPARTVQRPRVRGAVTEKKKDGKKDASRRKSIAGSGRERKARFGDGVKSPAHGLLRRGAPESTSSSAYTTMSESSPIGKRSRSQTRSTGRSNGGKSTKGPEEAGSDTDTEKPETHDPTPLAARLRSRTASYQRPAPSEGEADDEDDGSAPPSPTRTRIRRGSRKDMSSQAGRSFSRGGDVEMEDDVQYEDRVVDGRRRLGRHRTRPTPGRAAQRKALAAIRANADSSTGSENDLFRDDDGAVFEEDEGMDVDREPSSQTRSHRSSPVASQQSRRSSRYALRRPSSSDAHSSASELTPAPPSKSMDIDIDGDEETEIDEADAEDDDDTSRTTRSGRAFGTIQSRSDRSPDDGEAVEIDDDVHRQEFGFDYALTEATRAKLERLNRPELVQMCETRELEVGGTKAQLAQSLIDWRKEQRLARSTSSTPTPSASRISSHKSKKSDTLEHLHAIASHKHVDGDKTPVLLRSHVHGHDPATPHASPKAGKSGMATAKPGKANDASDASRRSNNEDELSLDLAEMGLEKKQIEMKDLEKLEKIGSGGFKDVYVGNYRNSKVAISEFREHLSEMDIRELKLLAEFKHSNIVKLKGICIPEDSSQVPCMLISELCENGDLFDYIRNVEKPPVKRLLKLMLDIARGLEYLHGLKPAIIHRDCKSSNILISRTGQAKVGDFGLARVKHSTRSMIRSLVGTVNWQAPELWHPEPQYDYKVDVFSAGVVYWEMMHGWGTGEQKYPWEGHNEHYIYDAVGQKHRRPPIQGLAEIWGEEPVKLMQRMWEQDPAERPTMTDVVHDLEAIIKGVRS